MLKIVRRDKKVMEEMGEEVKKLLKKQMLLKKKALKILNEIYEFQELFRELFKSNVPPNAPRKAILKDPMFHLMKIFEEWEKDGYIKSCYEPTLLTPKIFDVPSPKEGKETIKKLREEINKKNNR